MLDANMDSRKRHLADNDDGPGAIKKRIVEGPNGAPHVNGSAVEYDPDDRQQRQEDDLETFRKEALYRRMKHYSREHDRAQQRIAQLERSRSLSEAGVAAISACWSQLVDTITSVYGDVRPGDDRRTDIFELVDRFLEDDELPESFTEVLHEKLATTRSLVTTIAQTSGRSVGSPSQHTTQQVQELQTECTVLRSRLSTLRAELKGAISERDAYHEGLLRAETRLDRQRSGSGSLAASKARVPSPVNKYEDTDRMKPEPSPAASDAKAATPTPPTISEDVPLSSDASQRLLDNRDKEIAELKRQLAEERIARSQETFVNKNITFQDLRANAYFSNLMRQAERLQVQLDQARDEAVAHAQQLEDRYAQEQKLLQDNHALQQHAVTELRSQLNKRDAECVRLREKRDQLEAELNERRQKDGLKSSAFTQIKNLNKTLKERVDTLQSEVRRCKAHVAASAGDSDLMKFLFADDAADYIKTLRQDLTEAQQRIAALEQSCADDRRSDADIRVQLASAQAELTTYRSVYGDSASSPELDKLASVLRSKEAEVQSLRLEKEAQAQSMEMLYGEQDRLATAWDALEAQVNDKVFELIGVEEKLVKAREDKAKADNKYFAVSRDKNALEEEKRALQRKIDKAEALISKMTQDKALQSEANNSAHHQINLFRKQLEADGRKLDELTKNIGKLEADLAVERSKVLHTEESWRQREHQLAEAQAKAAKQLVHLTKLEDKVKHREKVLDDTAKAREKKAQSSSNGHELPPEVDMQMKMLKCSTCKLNFRSVILTKCMHTFCKDCIDARLTTRQRRCPSCDLTFTNSEVHKFYLQ
ncbi:hypothetical protein HDZ31DRAFT_65099 [Schizophyllum fasciatum]